MDTIVLFTWIGLYIILATLIFDIFRYWVKLNLANSFLLSTSIALLYCRSEPSEALIAWIAENSFHLIILGTLILTIIWAMKQRKNTNQTDDKNTDNNSSENLEKTS